MPTRLREYGSCRARSNVSAFSSLFSARRERGTVRLLQKRAGSTVLREGPAVASATLVIEQNRHTIMRNDTRKQPDSGEAVSARAGDVRITKDTLTVELLDGRTISVPLEWYPRLWHGTLQERKHWRLIGRGEGIHWPDLDEDIRVENLLAGRPAGESQRSFQRWLAQRQASRKTRRRS